MCKTYDKWTYLPQPTRLVRKLCISPSGAYKSGNLAPNLEIFIWMSSLQVCKKSRKDHKFQEKSLQL